MSEKGQGTEEVEVGTGTVLAEPGQTGSGGGMMTKPPEEQKYQGRQPTDEEYQEWKKTQAATEAGGTAATGVDGEPTTPRTDGKTYSSGDPEYLEWKKAQAEAEAGDTPATPEGGTSPRIPSTPDSGKPAPPTPPGTQTPPGGRGPGGSRSRDTGMTQIDPPNLKKLDPSVLEYQDPKDQKPVVS